MFDVMFKLKDFFKQYKKDYIVALITMFLSNLFSVFIPYLIGRFIDSIVNTELTYRLLAQLTALFIFSLVAAYLLEFIWSYYLFTGSAKLQRNMREQLMNHFLQKRSVFYEKYRVGDLLARSTQDVRSIADTTGFGMMVLMNATIFLTTIVTMMGATVSWRLTIFSLVPLIFLAYAFGKIGDLVEKRYTISQKAFSSLNNDVLEVVDGIRVTRAYVKEEDYINKFRSATESVLEKNNKVAEANALFMPIVKLFTSISVVISFGYGAYLVLNGVLSIGDMVSFQMYLTMIVWPIISIGELTNILRQGSASMLRVEEVLATSDDMEENGVEMIETSDNIIMEGLSFQYPPARSPIYPILMSSYPKEKY